MADTASHRDSPADTLGGIITALGTKTASATGTVDAPPSEVFDFIRRPANHAEISGDCSVRAKRSGAEVLGPESTFRMSMKIGTPYRINSRVVEFDENRVLAWRHLGGHRWRWELEPTDDGRTKITETFDGTTSRLPILLRLLGLPKGHVPNVAKSVANVVAHFAGPTAAGS